MGIYNPSIYDVCHEAGGMTPHAFEIDPKRLGFILARYKFVAKMLAGKRNVLEVGCADGYGSRVVRQAVGSLEAIDKDAQSIDEARRLNYSARWPINFRARDMFVPALLPDSWDAVYALDVFEHIASEESAFFLATLSAAAPVCIIGTPSLESQQYASELSKQGHVNCMSGEQLQRRCRMHWSQVFMFGMNDETLHTGYLPMAHYLFAVCVR